MVARRSSSIFLPYRALSPTLSRLRTAATAACGPELAPRSADNGLFFERRADSKKGQLSLKSEAQSSGWHTITRGSTESPFSTALDFAVLHTQSEPRIKPSYSSLKSWPASTRERKEYVARMLETPSFLEMFPIPHSTFRELLKHEKYPKKVRKIISMQLLHCYWPKDVLRIMAAALQDRVATEIIATMSEAIMRAVYRCRNNASDPEIMRLLATMITRFRHSGVAMSPFVLFLALKFAARSRSLSGMKKFLKIIRQDGIAMTNCVFREVIAKFSIGNRGLGEIRNGRWKRGDLLQVLKGFDDARDLRTEEQYHLESFLNRFDWGYMHGWVAVLARCRDSDAIWQEWEFWKQCPDRTNPRALKKNPREKCGRGLNTKDRGDFWFVEQMAYSGDIRKAWQVLGDADVEFDLLQDWVKDKLLDEAEYASISSQRLQAELLEKDERIRTRVKKDHEDFDYGFPYEDTEIERALHDNTTSNPAPADTQL